MWQRKYTMFINPEKSHISNDVCTIFGWSCIREILVMMMLLLPLLLLLFVDFCFLYFMSFVNFSFAEHCDFPFSLSIFHFGIEEWRTEIETMLLHDVSICLYQHTNSHRLMLWYLFFSGAVVRVCIFVLYLIRNSV